MRYGLRSPLSDYINTRLLVVRPGAPVINNGRYQDLSTSKVMILCFLKRMTSSTTDTGLKGEGTEGMMTGSSSQKWLYRGYALGYSSMELNNNFNINSGINGIRFTDCDFSEYPNFLIPGIRGKMLYGNNGYSEYNFELLTTSGIYGNDGIDNILRGSMYGVPIVLYGSNHVN